jgi:hypothetical protein
MASEDLDARKTALEDGIDSLSAWMIGFTWPVAIGLIMEFYAIFNASLTRDWNVIIDRIGLMLVTAGVSGELAVEHKTHVAERKLRRINTEIEREAQQESDRLNLEILRLRVKLADRSLTEDQQASIANNLREFRGTRINVFAIGGSSEALTFARDIVIALNKAEWVVSFGVGLDSGVLFSGVIVELVDGMPFVERVAATTLIGALGAEGVTGIGPATYTVGSFVSIIGSSDPDAKIRLVVSGKP